jgi:hypothetical protein
MKVKVIYPYSHIGTISPSKGALTRFRPMLDAILTVGNGTSLQWAALADSGADSCLFPLDAAKMLGLNLSSLPTATTGGVGNSNNLTYYETITIEIGNGLSFRTLVGFTEGMNRAGFGLLGQQGFFENYNVEFRHKERIFTIASNS